ncbi:MULTISPECIES: DUF2761 domain-containing protein [Burkholderiales]|uniref:DUF2761 domain-containing protein n=1 Tax=Burkholderiales TaxID=80840 RepID=UPI000A6EFF08|nr:MULTISPECIES: DUF2761 domain-containing protein [unclassified Variovorax]VTU45068.1 hypothetical protein RA8P3_00063 [Variovorax sp. RA8]VTU46248.1 hypothetical protein E5P3_00026 [Variovorax sp. PBL-E5]VTU46823.1 hypothetical protein SRS16P4_00067 [Variovorax sp. SRS16]
MTKMLRPYPLGYVCPNTGRVAVLVRAYADSDLNGDAPAYWYSQKSEEWGLDPWKLVEGVDPHAAGGSYDICFANGSVSTVGPLMTIFLGAADAARLNAKEEDERREALAVIAGDLGLDASALRIESLIESRPAVFYDMPDGTTRSACSLDSECWREALARGAAVRAIRQAKAH